MKTLRNTHDLRTATVTHSLFIKVVFGVLAAAVSFSAPVAAIASKPKLMSICKPMKTDDGQISGHLCKSSSRATVWHAARVVGETESDGVRYHLTTTLKQRIR